MDAKVHLSDGLNLMDEKTIGGVLQPFEVSFVAESGEIIRLQSCTKTGLKPGIDRRSHIGLKAIGNTHHPYTVNIRTILTINQKEVYW